MTDKIAGRVDFPDGTPVQGVPVFAKRQGGQTDILQTETDGNGEFGFHEDLFPSGENEYHVFVRGQDIEGDLIGSFDDYPYIPVEVDVENDIPDSGLLHEWDGRELSSASTFDDQVGTNDLTAAGSPSLVSDGINGRQSVLTDGSDDGYDGDSYDYGSGGEYTTAVVVEPQGTVNCVFDNHDGSFNNGHAIRNGYRITHYNEGSTADPVMPNGAVIVVASYDGSDVYIDVNGTTEIDGHSLALNTNVSDLAIGKRVTDDEHSNILFGHGLAYNEFYDSNGRVEIYNALANEWGF